MNRVRRLQVTCKGLLVLTALAACRGEPSPLGALSGITKAEVLSRIGHSPESVDTATITDSLQLEAITILLNQENGGWHGSWHTQPAGDLRVQFFRGDSSVGLLWVGPEFLAERASGSRLLKRVSPETERQLRRLLKPVRSSSPEHLGDPS